MRVETLDSRQFWVASQSQARKPLALNRMDPRTLNYIAEACSGVLLAGEGNTSVARICTDSRHAQPGDLFIALPGEKFDGHQFLADVAAKGVQAVLVNQSLMPRRPMSCGAIAVSDTTQALGVLAAQYRKEFSLPVFAVGGSNGKTTTKELLASVLQQKFSTLWSEASFNNHIGVPLTLLRLEQRHQVAILEVGTNHPGEIAALTGMVQPRYGIITSIGREHLEFFGDLQGVVREEGSLAELLPVDGKLFLNGDDGWAEVIAKRTVADVVRVGSGEQNDWRGQCLRIGKLGTNFRVESPFAAFNGDYQIKLLGRHQIVNALLALAAAATLGCTPEQVRAGFADCEPPKMRLQLWDLRGVRVLDDAYNANADSMLAALQTLLDLPCKGRRVAVLGDMAELGSHSEAAHEEVGRRAAELGVGQLFAIGKMAPVLARGARDAGLTRVLEFADVESAAVAVKSFVKTGDLLLLKASRSARLERVAELLRRI
jgi:UDP-N-acetylmuramoyl-tripeptide--D-alanyl-D-alanine ligase